MDKRLALDLCKRFEAELAKVVREKCVTAAEKQYDQGFGDAIAFAVALLRDQAGLQVVP